MLSTGLSATHQFNFQLKTVLPCVSFVFFYGHNKTYNFDSDDWYINLYSYMLEVTFYSFKIQYLFIVNKKYWKIEKKINHHANIIKRIVHAQKYTWPLPKGESVTNHHPLFYLRMKVKTISTECFSFKHGPMIPRRPTVKKWQFYYFPVNKYIKRLVFSVSELVYCHP